MKNASNGNVTGELVFFFFYYTSKFIYVNCRELA